MYIGIEVEAMNYRSDTRKKKWDSVNAIPGTNDLLKRIAVDEGKYIYKILDDLLREKYQEKYPDYFRKNRAV